MEKVRITEQITNIKIEIQLFFILVQLKLTTDLRSTRWRESGRCGTVGGEKQEKKQLLRMMSYERDHCIANAFPRLLCENVFRLLWLGFMTISVDGTCMRLFWSGSVPVRCGIDRLAVGQVLQAQTPCPWLISQSATVCRVTRFSFFYYNSFPAPLLLMSF